MRIGRIIARYRIWIREVNIAIALADDVIRAVQALAVVAIGQGNDGSVFLGARDAAVAMLAGDQTALAIDGQAVGADLNALRKITRKNRRAKWRESGSRSPLHNCVGGNIAEEQIPAAPHPHGSFGKLEIAEHLLDHRVTRDEPVECGIETLYAPHSAGLSGERQNQAGAPEQ